MLMTHGYLKAVFDVFDRYQCAIDMVSTSEVSISVTVDSNERLTDICAACRQTASRCGPLVLALWCAVVFSLRQT